MNEKKIIDFELPVKALSSGDTVGKRAEAKHRQPLKIKKHVTAYDE